MKKTISRALCLLLLIVVTLPVFSSCGNDDVYKLGDYSITQKEYNYLAGMFKKQVLVSINPDLTDSDLSLELQSGVTLSEYLEYSYRTGFEQSVLTLLYSQLLFDEYGLELTDEELTYIDATAAAVVSYYGEYSTKQFNSIAKEYGFDDKTLRSIYLKQYKENKVRQHILGENNENLTDDQIDSYYKDNYLRYKTIIINTLYAVHTDSNGDQTFVYLSEDEKKSQELLVTELKELLVNNNKNYEYVILKDDLDLSYDELWEKYSDDKFYPGGCYETSHPTDEQLINSNVLAAAYQSKVGDVKAVTAKRYFSGSGSISGEGGETEIKPGDYFEYGTVFVKRLPLDEKPYKKAENIDFFPTGAIESATANQVYYNTLMEHEKTSALTVEVSNKLEETIFENVKANELDYYILHGEQE